MWLSAAGPVFAVIALAGWMLVRKTISRPALALIALSAYFAVLSFFQTYEKSSGSVIRFPIGQLDFFLGWAIVGLICILAPLLLMAFVVLAPVLSLPSDSRIPIATTLQAGTIASTLGALTLLILWIGLGQTGVGSTLRASDVGIAGQVLGWQMFFLVLIISKKAELQKLVSEQRFGSKGDLPSPIFLSLILATALLGGLIGKGFAAALLYLLFGASVFACLILVWQGIIILSPHASKKRLAELCRGEPQQAFSSKTNAVKILLAMLLWSLVLFALFLVRLFFFR